jgi:hypothetical protein
MTEQDDEWAEPSLLVEITAIVGSGVWLLLALYALWRAAVVLVGEC